MKHFTKQIPIRMTPEMAKAVKAVAKKKKVTQSTFIRGAIEKSMPELCACGAHWGHTGKHWKA